MKSNAIQKCFVIMPFNEANKELQDNYKEIIKPAVENLGIQCVRSDEIEHGGLVIQAIMESIRSAYFIIADLTYARQNCYYELGFAHAIKRSDHVIVLAKKGQDLHFDIASFNVIEYSTAQDLKERLERRIIHSVLTSRSARNPDDPHFGKFGSCAVDMAKGRLLTARIEKPYIQKNGDPACDITVRVISLSNAEPLEGIVIFHPYNKGEDRYGIRKAAVVNGVASTTLEWVNTAFTVGAELDNKQTRLELDLGSLPGAPPTFYPETYAYPKKE